MHTQAANREIISALRDATYPIAQLKIRYRRRWRWMARLRKVTPQKWHCHVLACNPRSILN